MKSKNAAFRYLLLFIISIGIFCCKDSKKDSLLIGIIGDQTGASNIDNAYSIMSKAVDQLSYYNPDLVLHVGDIIESRKDINSYEDYKKNFDSAVKIMKKLQAPWFLTVGDHDVFPPIYKPCSEDRSIETWFRNLCKNAGLPIDSSLYYSFNVKGYHFISMYSFQNLHVDPRWGPIFLDSILDDQIDWLKGDLEKNKKAKGIVVFIHQPMWYVWSNWYKVHEILRKYPVAGVIAGHYHYDQDDGIIDDIHYIVMGSSGGSIKSIDKNSGGTYQFAILSLKDDKFTNIEIHEVDSDSILEFTPRRSMDRIQAISCMLDNVYKDENLFVKDNTLYTIFNSCNYSPVFEVGLESLANPIDIPIKIQISSFSKVLKNPRWVSSSKEISGDSLFTLLPGERIGWANYSNVGQWVKPKALWISDIDSSAVDIIIDKGIDIKIRISFIDIRSRWVEHDITFYTKNEP